MNNTKELILQTALHLFASDGYEAVSTDRIARQLGITKGALYRHYASKQDILQHIIHRMEENDTEQAQQDNVPAGTIEQEPEAYTETSLEDLCAFSKDMFDYWTADPFASDFRKLLTLEQYRNKELAFRIEQLIYSGPIGYTTDLLSTRMSPEAAHQRAAELLGVMTAHYSIYDHAEDKDAVRAFTLKWIDDFFARLNKEIVL